MWHSPFLLLSLPLTGRLCNFSQSSDALAWATQPGLISPRLVSKQHTAPVSPLLIHSHLEAFSAALLKFLVAFLSCNPLMPRSLSVQCRLCPGNPLQPTSIGSLWALQPFSCRPLPAQDTLPSSALGPRQSGLPRGLLVPPAPLALNSQMLGPFLAWVLCLWCALGTSTASQGSPSAASHTLMITAQLGPFAVTEISLQPWWMWCLAFLGAGVCTTGFQRRWHQPLHLVMVPSVTPLSQAFWADVLQRSSCRAQWTCWCFCQLPTM